MREGTKRAGAAGFLLLLVLALPVPPARADADRARADRFCEKAEAAERDAGVADRESEKRRRFLTGKGGIAPGTTSAPKVDTSVARQSIKAQTAQARAILAQLRQGAESATRDRGIVPGLAQYFNQMESSLGRMLQAVDACLDNPGACNIPATVCPPPPPMPSFSHSGSAEFIRQVQQTYAQAANQARQSCLDLSGGVRGEVERLKREGRASAAGAGSAGNEPAERFGEVDLQLRRAETLRREAQQDRQEADRASGVRGYCAIRSRHRTDAPKARAAVAALRAAGTRERKPDREIPIEGKVVDLKAGWEQPWEKGTRLEAPGVPLPKVSVWANGEAGPASTGDPEGEGGSWWRDKAKAGGTAFFGLGGGPGPDKTILQPEPGNDPMVVDLRHLRQASTTVQAVETATAEQVPALLDKALGAATGEISEPPAGTVAPAVDEKGLHAFRKVHDEYAWARDALAKSEAALKEARARKKGGGPEVDAAWEKARSAHDAAKKRAGESREEAVRVLRALGAGKDPESFRPPVPSIPSLREETWLEMQKRMMAERAAYDARQVRTQKELLSAVPPLKKSFEKVHEMVVLGFGTDNNDASRMMTNGVSPWSGKTYASMNEAAKKAGAEGKDGVGGAVVVSFGMDKEKEYRAGYGLTESGRIVGDHLTDGAISLNTPQARKALEQVSGKECDRLVAHSNGATVAEALIREDLVRVNELDIVGGDLSLAKSGHYQELVDSGKVKRVVVWVNLNDPVPWGTSIAPAELMASGADAMESMARKVVGVPSSGVDYRFMWGADYRILGKPDGVIGSGKRMAETLIAPHYVESSYFPGIANELGVDGYTLPARVRDDKPKEVKGR
ncbi:MAG TPA: hypothetical protein VGK27_10310 [Candidatus Deferrimicrobiaceae bacterium]|jgi:hypothetical protein